MAVALFGAIKHQVSIDLPQQVQVLSFEELALNAKFLAQQEIPVKVDGTYIGMTDQVGMLFRPGHKLFHAFEYNVKVRTDYVDNEGKRILYQCRQMENGCELQVEGRMEECSLEIFRSFRFPCLRIDRIIENTEQLEPSNQQQ